MTPEIASTIAVSASDGSTASTTTDVTTDTTTATTTSGETATESSSSSSSSEPVTPDDPIDCMGDFLECGDGKDNDGDGLFDLMDPECTGPCDDDEGSFQTGLPGDNVDCIQDCFFDGDSGQGNDGCIWVLTCCLPYVPPGCDCFGCCTVHTDNGDVDIFLNSGDECSLENIEGCETCTQSEDCINECEPELCEPCFGEEELPEGCDEPACEFGDACEATSDCPTNYYCVFDCCFPEPQG